MEKLVELGVTRLTPLITERGVAQPGEKAMVRIQRWIIAASKQSRRNRLLEVTEPKSIEQFGLISDDAASEATRLIAHPGDGRGIASYVNDAVNGSKWFVAVGPEGGFSDSEIAFARNAGYQQVTLGERILRVETAAIAIASSFVFGKT